MFWATKQQLLPDVLPKPLDMTVRYFNNGTSIGEPDTWQYATTSVQSDPFDVEIQPLSLAQISPSKKRKNAE